VSACAPGSDEEGSGPGFVALATGGNGAAFGELAAIRGAVGAAPGEKNERQRRDQARSQDWNRLAFLPAFSGHFAH